MGKILAWLKEHFVPLGQVSWGKVLLSISLVCACLAVSWWALEGLVPEPWHDYLYKAFLFLGLFITALLKAHKAGEPPTLPGK